jgi:hypothetical protein
MAKKLTKEQQEKLDYVWEGIKTGVAKNQHYKSEMTSLYNEIHNTNYSVNTNCGACKSTMYTYFKQLKTKKSKKIDKE